MAESGRPPLRTTTTPAYGRKSSPPPEPNRPVPVTIDGIHDRWQARDWVYLVPRRQPAPDWSTDWLHHDMELSIRSRAIDLINELRDLVATGIQFALGPFRDRIEDTPNSDSRARAEPRCAQAL